MESQWNLSRSNRNELTLTDFNYNIIEHSLDIESDTALWKENKNRRIISYFWMFGLHLITKNHSFEWNYEITYEIKFKDKI